MRVTTRRLLEEQMAVVVAADSGAKKDAMWHVPHYVPIICQNYLQFPENNVM